MAMAGDGVHLPPSPAIDRLEQRKLDLFDRRQLDRFFGVLHRKTPAG